MQSYVLGCIIIRKAYRGLGLNMGKNKGTDNTKAELTTGNQPPSDNGMVTVGYNAAVQFYNQELNAIGQRNAAFLIVQSILIAAFATLLVNANQLPWALAIFIWVITVGGSLFCLFHQITGESGANAASKWREYMRFVEGAQENTPWSKFDQFSETYHRRHIQMRQEGKLWSRCKSTYMRLRCDKCLVQRLPLPHTWITIPAIFASGWVFAAVYITTRLFMKDDPLHTNPFLPIGFATSISIGICVLTIAIVGYIVWRYTRWRKIATP